MCLLGREFLQHFSDLGMFLVMCPLCSIHRADDVGLCHQGACIRCRPGDRGVCAPLKKVRAYFVVAMPSGVDKWSEATRVSVACVCLRNLYVHIYVYARSVDDRNEAKRVLLHVCVYKMCACMYIYVCVHTYIHTHIHTCIHTCMHACMQTRMHINMHTHIYSRNVAIIVKHIPSRLCVCVCVCVCTCIQTNTHGMLTSA